MQFSSQLIFLHTRTPFHMRAVYVAIAATAAVVVIVVLAAAAVQLVTLSHL